MSEVPSIAALSIATPVEGQPIPTPEEIAACRDFIYEEDPGKNRGSKVLRFGKYAVKYGGRTEFREVENMKFLTKYPKIAAPKYRAHGYLPGAKGGDSKGELYIVTDYIEGETVEAAFNKLSPVDKEGVIRLIREQINEIRKIPDEGYLGGVGGTHYVNNSLTIFKNQLKLPPGADASPERLGPFATYDAFVDSWMQRLTDEPTQEPFKPVSTICNKMAREIWGTNTRTVFTHGDLAPKNIMLTRLGTNPDGSGIFRVTIIDWDVAGFYPEWWEFADAPLWWGSTPAWWVESIEKIMPTYFSERWVYAFYWQYLVFY
ncbi:hypothetical protein CB0940_05040 [Cercospora beticola]|uniref:Aminoglycoside phosphotransferase domain-containing protein n=1 Tax=Cercospora beticola TaxID=122368 RepID=A0A2G5HLI8_CERBT|nr:hypothetical protein CB0940_05040 [Cercospora beticola]PIA93072.1 hypothetical protein CB0940_05040 [Cercospora beticola]WPB02331.1 hypothetical protein RHO25_006965 [Cercospora beticola]CAK1362789.1 unnamed protein product [Cercospora beticola]